MKTLVRIALVTVLLAPAAAHAEAVAFVVTPAASPVTFVAVGKPGFLKIRGEGATVEGDARVDGGKLTGTFDVALTALKTGIDLRDEHMKDKYLEVGKFPKARLVLDPTPVAWPQASTDVAFTGKLTLKGVEKPVSGTLSLAAAGAGAKGTARFPVKIDEFPVGVPSYLGVTVAKEVTVELAIEASRKGADLGKN